MRRSCIGARTLLLTMLAFTSGLPAHAATSADAAPEYQVKAAFLFQFSRFVEWPAQAFVDADSPLHICVFGTNPFGSTLEEITRGESVQSHALMVRTTERVEQLDGCHIVFLSSNEPTMVRQVLPYLEGKGILTVGDSNDFVKLGGVIGFITVDGKVRLQVNRNSAETEQLRISAKLLRVAENTG